MDASSIMPADAKRIGKALQPGLDYLRRLRERMVAVRFLPDDPLFAAVVKAHDAAGELFVAKHYAIAVPVASAAPGSGGGRSRDHFSLALQGRRQND